MFQSQSITDKGAHKSKYKQLTSPASIVNSANFSKPCCTLRSLVLTLILVTGRTATSRSSNEYYYHATNRRHQACMEQPVPWVQTDTTERLSQLWFQSGFSKGTGSGSQVILSWFYSQFLIPVSFVKQFAILNLK